MTTFELGVLLFLVPGVVILLWTAGLVVWDHIVDWWANRERYRRMCELVARELEISELERMYKQ